MFVPDVPFEISQDELMTACQLAHLICVIYSTRVLR